MNLRNAGCGLPGKADISAWRDGNLRDTGVDVIRFFSLGCLLAAAAVFFTPDPAPRLAMPPSTPQLWYWHHAYLATDEAVDSSKALIDKAAAAGYTGLVLWDAGWNLLGGSFWPWENEDRMREVLKYAVTKKGMRVLAQAAPFGYSNDVLTENPNWAEAQRVVGTRFQVDPSGRRLVLKSSFSGLANRGFESGKSDWFDTNDSGIGVNEVAHSGKGSAVIVDAPGNARLRQRVTLQPWREYYLRVFYKSKDFHGGPMVEVLDRSDKSKVRFNANIHANGTQDWTQLEFAFNSRDTTDAYLYLGVWGGSKGILWFDDLALEETALVYLTRRPGTPLKIYDPDHPETTYAEGTDVNPVVDPTMVSQRNPFNRVFVNPPAITLPARTRLKPGQIVAVDSYSALPLPIANETGMCPTEPAVWNWMRQNARIIKRILPREAGLFLQFDEIRQWNSCASCRAKKMTAAQLLGWTLDRSLQLYNRELPGAQLYIWNDMFDPYHNARDNYYYAEGDFTGSWTALPSNVTVMNWNLDKLRESLQWFAGLDRRQPNPHQQIIAGYYDSGNGADAAQKELKQAEGIPGVAGFMYTTYNDDYSQLQSFASAAKAGWKAYAGSVNSAGSGR